MKTTWPVCACEYQFIDEDLADLIERLKEMLDIDVTINDLDATQEIPAEIGEKSVPTGRIHKVALCVPEQKILILLPVFLITLVIQYAIQMSFYIHKYILNQFVRCWLFSFTYS